MLSFLFAAVEKKEITMGIDFVKDGELHTFFNNPIWAVFFVMLFVFIVIKMIQPDKKSRRRR